MDDIENIRKKFDVFKGESGNLLLKPKKRPRNDFDDFSMDSTSTCESSSIIVDEAVTSVTVPNSDSMETSGQV